MPVDVKLKALTEEEASDNSDFLLEEATPYVAKLSDINEVTYGIYGPQYEWTFTTLMGNTVSGKEAKGITIKKLTSMKLFPGGKLWNFIQKMFNRSITPGEELNVNDLIGLNYVIVVEHTLNKKNKKQYNEIKTIKKYIKKDKK